MASNAGGRRANGGRKPTQKGSDLVPAAQVSNRIAQAIAGASDAIALTRTFHERQDLPLAALPAREQDALRSLAKGRRVAGIAQRIQMPPEEVRGLPDLYPAAYDDALQQINDPLDLYRPLIPKAVQAIEDALNAEDEMVRFRAGVEVMDRTGGKAVIRTQVESRGVINVVFQTYTPGEET